MKDNGKNLVGEEICQQFQFSLQIHPNTNLQSDPPILDQILHFL